MRTAKKCGVKVPEVTLLDFGKPVLAVGGARDIRDVKPSSFDLLASSLGITSSYLRSIVAPIVDNTEAAIREAGSEPLGPSQEFLPYLADDLQEDIAPCLRVLEEFCNL